jgi:methionine biosynthesis protein MetW
MNQVKLHRNTDWSKSIARDRVFDEIICGLTRQQERVLDLGCGSGELLYRLKKEKQVQELGIELDSDYVADCLSRGLRVIQGDLEESIIDFDDSTFDLVILNQVMLSVPKPLDLLENGLRVGKRVVITFPNFAHWKIRLQIMLRGRLPVNKDLPYEWYETPNIRLATVDDFMNLCQQKQITMLEKQFISQSSNGKHRPIIFRPNLRSSVALFCLANNRRNIKGN